MKDFLLGNILFPVCDNRTINTYLHNDIKYSIHKINLGDIFPHFIDEEYKMW